MKRRMLVLGMIAAVWSQPSWSQAPATLPADVAAALNTAVANGDAGAVATLINNNPTLVTLIAAQVVANGSATLVSTLVNASISSGGATAANPILAAFTSAMATSNNASLVTAVLAQVPASATGLVAGEIKAAAPPGSAVASLSTVAAATVVAPVAFNPPPVLVVNPNQACASCG